MIEGSALWLLAVCGDLFALTFCLTLAYLRVFDDGG